MAKFNFDTSKAKLKEINSKYVDLHKRCVADGYDEIRRTLQPGQTMPKHKGIPSAASREVFSREASRLASEARAEVEKMKSAINEYKTAAPSEEAARYVSMLSMREHIAQNDIDLALDRYGDNYATMQTINSIASKHGKAGAPDPLARIDRAVSIVESDVNHIGHDAYRDSIDVAGVRAFADADIDAI